MLFLLSSGDRSLLLIHKIAQKSRHFLSKADKTPAGSLNLSLGLEGPLEVRRDLGAEGENTGESRGHGSFVQRNFAGDQKSPLM